jgi:hypothetical protein
MNFLKVGVLQDYIMAETFEGTPRRYNFSGMERAYIGLSQKAVLYMPLDTDGTQLQITKQLSRPLRTMSERADDILAGRDTSNSLRYILYSAHDDQVCNLLLFLDPVGLDFQEVPYVSTVYMELFYDEDCIKTQKDRKCFRVRSYFQNKPIKFDTCLESNAKQGEKSIYCFLDDLIAHYDKKKYQGDVKAACLRPYP